MIAHGGSFTGPRVRVHRVRKILVSGLGAGVSVEILKFPDGSTLNTPEPAMVVSSNGEHEVSVEDCWLQAVRVGPDGDEVSVFVEDSVETISAGGEDG